MQDTVQGDDALIEDVHAVADSGAEIRVDTDGVEIENYVGQTATGNATGVIDNGQATESASANRPQRDWPVGTVVHFTDTGDGSGSGIYVVDPSNTPRRIA